MKAKLIYNRKRRYHDGAIREMVIWRLPAPDAERPQGLKYRLFYGYLGKERLVCYDNERGKGDHRHFRGTEGAYDFESVEQLIKDFLQDVEEVQHG